MDYETTEETEVAVEEAGEIQNEADDVENFAENVDPEPETDATETESFSTQVVEEDDMEYVAGADTFAHEIESHEEVNVAEHEEYTVNEEFVTEEPYQQEVINNELVEEELHSSNIENNEEVVQYQEQPSDDYAAEDNVVQEELVSDQSIVEGKEEEISTEQHVSVDENYISQEPDSHGDSVIEPHQEETVQEDHEQTIGMTESISPDDENDPKQADAEHESDEDFDNVVEVEQKVESDAEDDNIAEHVSDSDNEGDEKTEEIKLGNVSDDDLQGASSGSEHEASDVEEHSSSPMKKRPTVLESDNEEEENEDEKKKREQEAALKMFDSDSEDEEKGGVGELIADIFGESDDEGEEFTGFGAEEVSKNQESTKSVISDDSDDDSLPARPDDSDDDDIGATKSTKKSTQPEDSDSDEGVKSSSFQGMSDFDIMLAKKKEENRRHRKRRDNSTFITDADDIINAMLTKMKEAAESDRDSNTKRKPALAKMKMLPSVVRHLKKQNLKELFVDNGVIAAIADWLSILPDRSLPHITIRTELLKVLHDLPSVGPETLKHSGIGKAVMILFKHPKEVRSNKDSAGRLINKWSRPIFGLNENFKSMSREEREQRDLEQMPQAKRRKLTGSGQNSQGDPRMDAELGQLRPGEAGFIMRARVPMPSTKDYVVRPKWNIDADDKADDDDDDEQPARIVKRRRSAGAPRSSKKDERLDKHIRSFAEKKRNTKLQRAVKISIEGNKMSIV